MAAQISRSPLTNSRYFHNSTDNKVGAPTFSLCRTASHRLPPSLSLKKTSQREFRLRPCSSHNLEAAATAAAAAPGEVKQQEQKNLRVFKLAAALVLPAILLRAAPALATTLATSTTGGATGLRLPELVASAWTGFMAGCLHTLTGPDHLAALAPLSIGRSKMEGALVGALWGCGHDAGQIMFGLLFLVLKDKLHIDLVRTWSARVVGVTLVAIGALGIKEAQEEPVPCLAGEAGCEADYGDTNGGVTERKKPFGFATFGTGVVHGLQPDALLVILPALALPSRLAGISFLFMFLVGTVAAMASYTAFVGSCSEMLRERVPWMTQRLSFGSSLIAIVVGLLVLVGEVFGVNLF